MRNDGVRDWPIAFQQPSGEAATSFVDEALDCVFSDGDHRYDEVRADIAAWLPKLKPGGLLAGDDYDQDSHPGVWRAVREKFGNETESRGRSRLHRRTERQTARSMT